MTLNWIGLEHKYQNSKFVQKKQPVLIKFWRISILLCSYFQEHHKTTENTSIFLCLLYVYFKSLQHLGFSVMF